TRVRGASRNLADAGRLRGYMPHAMFRISGHHGASLAIANGCTRYPVCVCSLAHSAFAPSTEVGVALCTGWQGRVEGHGAKHGRCRPADGAVVLERGVTHDLM